MLCMTVTFCSSICAAQTGLSGIDARHQHIMQRLGHTAFSVGAPGAAEAPDPQSAPSEMLEQMVEVEIRNASAAEAFQQMLPEGWAVELPRSVGGDDVFDIVVPIRTRRSAIEKLAQTLGIQVVYFENLKLLVGQ